MDNLSCTPPSNPSDAGRMCSDMDTSSNTEEGTRERMCSGMSEVGMAAPIDAETINMMSKIRRELQPLEHLDDQRVLIVFDMREPDPIQPFVLLDIPDHQLDPLKSLTTQASKWGLDDQSDRLEQLWLRLDYKVGMLVLVHTKIRAEVITLSLPWIGFNQYCVICGRGYDRFDEQHLHNCEPTRLS